VLSAVLLACGVTVFAPSGVGGAAPEDTAPSCGTAYIALALIDQVLPVDVLAGTTGEPITVPGAFQVGIAPDARTAWVLGNHETDPAFTITRVDLVTGEVGEPAPLTYIPSSGPASNVVVSPDGTKVYVGTLDRLGVLDANTLDVITTIPYIGAAIYSKVALTPDGGTAFIGTGSGSAVLAVDLHANTAGPLIPTGAWPIDVSVSPDGSSVYAANQLSGSITPIDVATMTPRPAFELPFSPAFVNAAPDGGSAAVSSYYELARLDLGTGATSASIPIGSSGGTVLMPDGRTSFVLDVSGPAVYAVDVDTGIRGPSVPLPDYPHGIAAIAPSQAPTAAFTNGAALSGQPTLFDASASTATCGDVAAYEWDYGDGLVETTSTPTAQHVYAEPGSYHVSLRVTDGAGTSTTKAFTGQAMLRNGGPEAEVAQTVVVNPGPVVPPRFTG
jgi:hypothetical protein